MIKQYDNIKFNNVFSCRKMLEISELNNNLNKVNKFLKDNDIKKTDYKISVTHAYHKLNKQIVDTEILFTVDKEFDSNEEYKFYSNFCIENIISDVSKLNNADVNLQINNMQIYLKNNKLKPVTPIYIIQKIDDSDFVQIIMGVKSEE